LHLLDAYYLIQRSLLARGQGDATKTGVIGGSARADELQPAAGRDRPTKVIVAHIQTPQIQWQLP